MSLENRFFVVTGATSGIGFAVAKLLVQQDASVIGVGRSPERCRDSETKLDSSGGPASRVIFIVADLSVQTQVRLLAEQIRTALASWGSQHLDTLINNAATVPFWQTLTAEGFETQWAVNHLAPFLLTLELVPTLERAPMGRVVTVSSGSHYGAHLNWEDLQLRRHYSPLRAYGQTKLANVLFTAEFNRRIGATRGIRAFAADPGLVNTELGFKSDSPLARFVWDLRRRGGISAQEAAQGIVYLASEPSIQGSDQIYWKHAKPRSPSQIALNPQVARELWEVSEQMCSPTP